MAERNLRLKVRLVEDTSGGLKETRNAIKKLQKQAKQTSVNFQQLGRTSGTALAGITTGSRGAASALGAVSASASQVHVAVVAVVAALAPLAILIGGANRLLSKGREEYAGQAQAAAQLAAVWESMGRQMPIEQMHALASQMQAVSTFGDDAVLQGVKMLATFPKITEELLPKAVKTMVDFASFNKNVGMTLEQAASSIGKVSMGQFGIVERTGITFSQATKDVKSFGMALDDMNRQLGGQALATISTYSGKLEQLGNYWGDLFEPIGELQDEALVEAIQVIIDGVEEMTKQLQEWLKTDEAKKFMEVFRALVVEFAHVVVELIAWGGELAHKFAKDIASIDPADITEAIQEFAGVLFEMGAAIKYCVGLFVDFVRWWHRMSKAIEESGWYIGTPFRQVGEGTNEVVQQVKKGTKEVEAEAVKWEMIQAHIGSNTKSLVAEVTKGIKEELARLKDITKQAEADGGIAPAVLGGMEPEAFKNMMKGVASDFKEFMGSVKTAIKDAGKDDWQAFGKQAQLAIGLLKAQLQDLAKTTISSTGTETAELEKLAQQFEKLKTGGINALKGLASQATAFIRQIDQEIKRVEDRINKLKEKAAADLAAIEGRQHDATRALERSTMTDTEKLGESIDFITQQTDKAKQEAAKGTVAGYKQAQKTLEDVNREAQQLTQYQQEFEKAGDPTWGRDFGIGIVNQTSEMLKQYRQAQADLEVGDATKEKQALEERKKGYEGIVQQIQVAIGEAGQIKLDIEIDTEKLKNSIVQAYIQAQKEVSAMTPLQGKSTAAGGTGTGTGGAGGDVTAAAGAATGAYTPGSFAEALEKSLNEDVVRVFRGRDGGKTEIGKPGEEDTYYTGAVDELYEFSRKLAGIDVPTALKIFVSKEPGLSVTVEGSGNVNQYD